MAPALWANLPPDLLGDVSGHLHDPVDFTRFHAVCTAWRDSPTSSRRPTFHPGLLTLNARQGQFLHSSVNFSPEKTKRRLSYYRISWRDIRILLKKPPGGTLKKPISRTLVASANGTAAWLFITTDSGTGLLDLLTGAVTLLPAYDDKMQQKMKNPRGIVYADGTVFLYSFADNHESKKLAFTSAILRPGDATWTSVNTMLDYMPYFTSSYFGNTAVACQDGKILVCVNMEYWCMLTLDDDGASRKLEPSITWYDEHRYRSESYILEFQGQQLLWVSVLVHTGEADLERSVSLAVHALEQDKMLWVIQSLNNHVLFLGSHASFFMDAGVLHGEEGGCAYFLFGNDVMRYSFVKNETKLVERIVHPECPMNESQNMHWLQLRPAIAPIQDIRRRLRI